MLNEKDLENFVRSKLKEIGRSACPPYHLAIVVGGTSAEANLKTVKLASCGYLDHLPTSGFVIAARLEGPGGRANTAVVKQWLGAGAVLGNHGYAHLSLLDTPVDDYVADIGKARQLLGYEPKIHLPQGIEMYVKWWRDNGWL